MKRLRGMSTAAKLLLSLLTTALVLAVLVGGAAVGDAISGERCRAVAESTAVAIRCESRTGWTSWIAHGGAALVILIALLAGLVTATALFARKPTKRPKPSPARAVPSHAAQVGRPMRQAPASPRPIPPAPISPAPSGVPIDPYCPGGETYQEGPR